MTSPSIATSADVTRSGARNRQHSTNEPKLYDFRRPSKLNRGHVRKLHMTYETFARQFTTILTSTVRVFSLVELIAVEQLYSHYAHPRTAILMGHARGVILLCAQRRRVTIEEFAANRIKKNLTGNGHAGKPQMQRAIQAIWNLPEPPDPPDVADALAVALCCGRSVDPESRTIVRK